MEYTDGSIKFKVRRVGSVPDKKSMVPTGVVMPYAGDTAPEGFLLCNGQAVSRTTYANLFTFIGTKYGAGDGSTTFNVPNLVNRFVEGGSASGETKEAGLPNITGEVGIDDQMGGALPEPFIIKVIITMMPQVTAIGVALLPASMRPAHQQCMASQIRYSLQALS